MKARMEKFFMRRNVRTLETLFCLLVILELATFFGADQVTAAFGIVRLVLAFLGAFFAFSMRRQLSKTP